MTEQLPKGWRIRDMQYWDDDPYMPRQLYALLLERFVPQRVKTRRILGDKVFPAYWDTIQRAEQGVGLYPLSGPARAKVIAQFTQHANLVAESEQFPDAPKEAHDLPSMIE